MQLGKKPLRSAQAGSGRTLFSFGTLRYPVTSLLPPVGIFSCSSAKSGGNQAR